MEIAPADPVPAAPRRPNRVVAVAGGLAAALGVAVMVGWHTRNLSLLQIHPAFIAMVYNTAAGFVACGMALLAVARGRPALAVPCGFAAVALGLLVLIQYAGGVDLGIDQLLLSAWDNLGNSRPGRMAPKTALCFVFAGTAVLFMSLPLRHRLRPS